MTNGISDNIQCFSLGFNFSLGEITNNNYLDIALSSLYHQFPPAEQGIRGEYDINDILHANSTDTLIPTRDLETFPIAQQKTGEAPYTGAHQDKPNDQVDLFPHKTYLSDNKWKIEHWTISAQAYERLSVKVKKLTDAKPSGYSFPGRSAFSRYLSNYLRGFDPHLPFLHLPTTSPNDMSSPLLLAVATAGAFYDFEHPQGYSLYLAARAAISQKFEQRRPESLRNLIAKYRSYAKLPGDDFPRFNAINQNESISEKLITFKALEIAQALIVLIQLTSWVDPPVICDAFSMTSQLAVLVQEGLAHTTGTGSGFE